MPTESDLRGLLGDPQPGTGGIDVEAVLRRARSRRRARVLAGTAAGALAVAGVLVPVTLTTVLGGESPTTIVAEESASDADAQDSDAAAPESATAPGGPTLEFAPDPSPPWRIDIADPVGDLATCSEDSAVETTLRSADEPSSAASLTLVEDATAADVTRVVECLLGSLSGGAITVSAPQ